MNCYLPPQHRHRFSSRADKWCVRQEQKKKTLEMLMKLSFQLSFLFRRKSRSERWLQVITKHWWEKIALCMQYVFLEDQTICKERNDFCLWRCLGYLTTSKFILTMKAEFVSHLQRLAFHTLVKKNTMRSLILCNKYSND
jgi:hypothetical protein